MRFSSVNTMTQSNSIPFLLLVLNRTIEVMFLAFAFYSCINFNSNTHSTSFNETNSFYDRNQVEYAICKRKKIVNFSCISIIDITDY